VNVRAKEQRRQFLRSRPAPKNIPRGIYANVEARLSQQSNRICAPGKVRLRESDAAHATFGILSDFCKLLKSCPQALLVHVPVGGCLLFSSDYPSADGHQTEQTHARSSRDKQTSSHLHRFPPRPQSPTHCQVFSSR